MNIIDKCLNKEDLIKYFRELGVREGMILEVHSSMKSFDYIIGGAETIIDALLELITYTGTIVMPLQCFENSEPSRFFKSPNMDFELYDKYRENRPIFDFKNSDSGCMGKLAESLRRREKTICSNHPNCSFIAIGKYAKMICSEHELSYTFGDKSPVKKLYDLKAHALMINVDYDNLTSLHYAEFLTKVRPIILNGCAYNDDGIRVWKKYYDYDYNSDDGFIEIGHKLENMNLVNTLNINKTTLKLFRVDVIIDEGVKYYKERK